jgi:hypothetical protein
MAIDLGIVGPFVRLHIIPEAHPAYAQQGGNDQSLDESDRTAMENATAVSGIIRIGAVALIVLVDLITRAYIVRLRSSLQSLLQVAQVLHFKPQPLNFFVKAVLAFRY